jgi:hypothetical protein
LQSGIWVSSHKHEQGEWLMSKSQKPKNYSLKEHRRPPLLRILMLGLCSGLCPFQDNHLTGLSLVPLSATAVFCIIFCLLCAAFCSLLYPTSCS